MVIRVPSAGSRRSVIRGVCTKLLIPGIDSEGPMGQAFYQGAEQGKRSREADE
jgi:hypothetical protein